MGSQQLQHSMLLVSLMAQKARGMQGAVHTLHCKLHEPWWRDTPGSPAWKP
jgi:hypothetical protein